MKADTSYLQRRYRGMSQEEFSLAKRDDLTTEAQAIYDEEVQRRKAPDWKPEPPSHPAAAVEKPAAWPSAAEQVFSCVLVLAVVAGIAAALIYYVPKQPHALLNVCVVALDLVALTLTGAITTWVVRLFQLRHSGYIAGALIGLLLEWGRSALAYAIHGWFGREPAGEVIAFLLQFRWMNIPLLVGIGFATGTQNIVVHGTAKQ